MSKSVAEAAEQEIMRLFKKLTAEERQKFSANGEQLYRLAKTLLCAGVPEMIVPQFAAESILKAIKQVRRIDNNRMS